VGKSRRDRPEKRKTESPGRNDFRRHAPLRSCTKPRRVWRTAVAISSMAGIRERTTQFPSARRRIRYVRHWVLLAAGSVTPRVGPIQPHKVGETNSCLRHRRRLFHSMASSGRPNRAPIEAVDSIRTQWRYKASIIAVPAYQRHGCSQSGSRLIVWPQARQRNLRIQMRTHPVSTNPQTWREYMPWPTIWSLPLALRAACPQTVQ